MARVPFSLLLLWAGRCAALPSCDVQRPAQDVCADFCSYRCSFYNVSAGDSGRRQTVTLYRLTPLNVTGLRNKNTGDPSGDICYWLSKKNMSQKCAQDPRAHGCVDAAHDLYGVFRVEVDGQYGPYLQCNPVQGGGEDPYHAPLWMDTSNNICGQNCLIATTEGCYNRDMPTVLNGSSAWGDIHCACDGTGRDNKTVGRTAPPFLGGPPGWVPQCQGFQPAPKGLCLAGHKLRSLSAWSPDGAMSLACDECRKDARCAGWSLDANSRTAVLLSGDLTEESGNCTTSGRVTKLTRTTSWFGLGELGGLWYSTPVAGECPAGAQLGEGGCTWREVSSDYKNASCVGAKVDRAVERHGASCFDGCPQPRNHTSDCYLTCYRDVLTGNALTNMTRISPQRLIKIWVRALERPPREGGCPSIAPEPCRGRQCDPLLDDAQIVI